jgi:hypothetical protein
MDEHSSLICLVLQAKRKNHMTPIFYEKKHFSQSLELQTKAFFQPSLIFANKTKNLIPTRDFSLSYSCLHNEVEKAWLWTNTLG